MDIKKIKNYDLIFKIVILYLEKIILFITILRSYLIIYVFIKSS